MSTRNLDKLFEPKSVVAIGASGRVGSVGEAVTRNLLAGGFKGDIHLVGRASEAMKSAMSSPKRFTWSLAALKAASGSAHSTASRIRSCSPIVAAMRPGWYVTNRR